MCRNNRGGPTRAKGRELVPSPVTGSGEGDRRVRPERGIERGR